MVKVIAHHYLQEDLQDKALRLVEELVAETRKEEGCIEYDYFQDNNDPTHFIFVELWETQEALDCHTQTPHFTKIVPEVHKMNYKDGGAAFFTKKF